VAELLRIQGELVILEGASDALVAAERHFRRALDWARQQQALAWELRTATSLGRLLRDQDRLSEAYRLLGSVYDRFTEGFGTADLREANNLLERLV